MSPACLSTFKRLLKSISRYECKKIKPLFPDAQPRNEFQVTGGNILVPPRTLIHWQTDTIDEQQAWLKTPKTLKNIYLRSLNLEACRTNVQLTEQN